MIVRPVARVSLGSPDAASVSSHHVDLHPHQPDPPNQCGRGTDEARREALRNRLLQKQSRRLAERRVSHPLPPGSGRTLASEAAYPWASNELGCWQGKK